jgi:hypothetical protein
VIVSPLIEKVISVDGLGEVVSDFNYVPDGLGLVFGV